MRVLIIEDEKPAAKRLEHLILDYDPTIEVIEKLASVKSVIQWFLKEDKPDLVFMDIQLADGLSFEIFDHVTIDAPIIFTTAYDEYALKAFNVNSVAYLLKPVDKEDLFNAFTKLNTLQQTTNGATPSNHLEQVAAAVKMFTKQYKNRFVIKIGEHIRSVAVHDILYFFSREKATFCTVTDGKNYLLDYPLQQLMPMLDPTEFFQINRQYIISLRSINDMISYSNSRLKIILEHGAEEEVIVSRERVNDFKIWLDQ